MDREGEPLAQVRRAAVAGTVRQGAGTLVSDTAIGAVSSRVRLSARARAARAWFEAGSDADKGEWFLWLPVLFAVGSAMCLALPKEPVAWAVALLAAAGLAAAALAWRGVAIPAAFIAAGLIAGFAAAKVRTEWVAAPALAASTGAVMLTGRVEDVAPTGPKSARLRIEVVAIDGIDPAAWPARAGLRLFAGRAGLPPRGALVRVKAVLRPLALPLMPGGYDHARTLWFRGIGARGHAVGPIEILPSDRALTIGERIDEVRAAIGARIRAALPGTPGALAEALIVGERGHLPDDVTDALQVSGLAHILSISGLHMSLVGGGVFFAVRALLALSPGLALRFPVKAWAAVAGLLAAAIYLAISGGGPATVRSFVMIAVMFVAILAGRPALAMRNLAIAALIVLMISPESVFDPGFQMSFMAVMGLIAVNDWRARRAAARPAERPRVVFASPLAQTGWAILRAGLLGLAGIAITSLVASTFSGVPAAFHFNRVSLAGVLANLLALPVVSLAVMPAAVAAMLAMPFGLEAWPLAVMGAGIRVVVAVAEAVAALPGAATAIASPPAATMALAVFGLIAICIGGGRAKAAGAGLLGVAVALALIPRERPLLLVEAEGRTVAVRGAEGGLVPLPGRRGRFVIGQWLLSEGDATPPGEAAKRAGWSCRDGVCEAASAPGRVLYIARGAPPPPGCGAAAIVVAADPLYGRCGGAGLVIDRFDLWRRGAHAVYAAPDGGLRVETAAGLRGERPWTIAPVPRASIIAGGRNP